MFNTVRIIYYAKKNIYNESSSNLLKKKVQKYFQKYLFNKTY